MGNDDSEPTSSFVALDLSLAYNAQLLYLQWWVRGSGSVKNRYDYRIRWNSVQDSDDSDEELDEEQEEEESDEVGELLRQWAGNNVGKRGRLMH